jgi:hypothetical protein
MAEYVSREWARVEDDEAAFSSIACEAMSRFPLTRFDPGEMVKWAVARDELPVQADVNSLFGEPAFTAFSNGRFQIDFLFWMDATTAVHQHMFSGAFQVVRGASLHTQFQFTRSRRVNSRLQLGHLRPNRSELLDVGAVRPIVAGDGLIHSVFHLERPSVTLVVRTPGEADKSPQFDYLHPGIAIDTRHASPAFKKRIQLLRALARINHPDLLAAVKLMLARSTFETTARMLFQTDLMMAPGVRECLVEACERFGEMAPWLTGAHEHASWLHGLVLWRRVLKDPDVRLFLGLLMNRPSRSDLLHIVADRYGPDPEVRIAGWIRCLLDVQRGVEVVPPIIDAELGEEDLTLVRELLRAGGSGDSSPLQGTTPGGRAEALRTSKFLQALLS